MGACTLRAQGKVPWLLGVNLWTRRRENRVEGLTVSLQAILIFLPFPIQFWIVSNQTSRAVQDRHSLARFFCQGIVDGPLLLQHFFCIIEELLRPLRSKRAKLWKLRMLGSFVVERRKAVLQTCTLHAGVALTS